MNEPIDVSELPRLSEDAFVGVSPKSVSMVAMLIRSAQALVVVSSIVVAVLVSPWLLVGGLVVLAGLEGALIVRKLAFPYLGYQARELDFSVRSGLIHRSVITVPFKRVQNSVVHQGPLERKFGLSTITVASAAGAVRLSGLIYDDATKLREFIVERAGALGQDDADGA